MSASIFNFHDLVLIVTSMGAFLLGVCLILFPKKKNPSRKFLAGFFLCQSLTNVANLFFWHSLLREFSIHHSNSITFIYIAASLTKGAMLYFYVQSILDNYFALSKSQIIQLITSPVAALVLVISGLGVLHIAAGVPFNQVDQLSYCFAAFLFFVPWCYSVLCAGEISRMDAVLRSFYASPIESGTTWFKLLVYGYIVVWSWQLSTQLFSGYLSTIIDGGLPNIFGLVSNYLDFGLLFALYAYSVSRAYVRLSVALDNVDSHSDQIVHQDDQPLAFAPNLLDADQGKIELFNSHSASVLPAASRYWLCANKLADAMEIKKTYLDHTINLERVADRIGEKAKDVSHVLHAYYRTSFFEFINGYRVAEAKRLLIADRSLSINEVMVQSGFSSKSAFHRVFKADTQMTPHQFRHEKVAAPDHPVITVKNQEHLSLSH